MIYIKYVCLAILWFVIVFDDEAIRLLSYSLLLISLIGTDYHSYLRSGKSIFFADKTQIEKDLREIQKLEIKNKLEELSNKK
jgi:hypothetical protein